MHRSCCVSNADGAPLCHSSGAAWSAMLVPSVLFLPLITDESSLSLEDELPPGLAPVYIEGMLYPQEETRLCKSDLRRHLRRLARWSPKSGEGCGVSDEGRSVSSRPSLAPAPTS